VFRKATGMNFSDYIAQYRLKLAKQWLIGSEMNISDIAEKLQYSNLQNFSRYFRKMEGLSPSEFRLTNRRAASEPLQSSED
jgi:YesN/AraC family two-component response regulator